ncbi:MAG: PAS domain-containing protein [Acidobacteria bacterium]|nr:PAS domain-containing protein [Acidobacteriota bacterium]
MCERSRAGGPNDPRDSGGPPAPPSTPGPSTVRECNTEPSIPQTLTGRSTGTGREDLAPLPSTPFTGLPGETRIEHELRAERNFIDAILETTGAFIAALDPQGRFLRGNRACETLTGVPFPNLIGRFFWDFASTVAEAGRLRQEFQRTLTEPGTREIVSAWFDRTGATRHVLWHLNCLCTQEGEPEYLIASGLDITEAVRLRQERELLISQLQDALARIKTLRGLIPICAGCKKIRDDRGYWHQVEQYVSEHSEAEFSHGMCPECIKKFYPEFYDRVMAATASPPAPPSASSATSVSVSVSESQSESVSVSPSPSDSGSGSGTA